MILQDIATVFRELADDVETDYLWSDTFVDRVANEAQAEACRRSRLLLDETTAAVCQIPVVAGTAIYNVDPRVLFIRRAKLAAQEQPLAKIHPRDLDRHYPGWETNQATTPMTWAPVENHKLRLVDKPDADDTLNLIVVRLPLAPMTRVGTGTALAVTGITSAGGVATAVLAAPDATLATGASVLIAGANQSPYNGSVVITAVDTSTFTYAVAGSPASPATGTITYAPQTVDVGPEIDERFHLRLVDWMLYRAFMSRDRQEKYNPDEAKVRLAEFEAEFGQRSSAIDETWINREHGYQEFEGLY